MPFSFGSALVCVTSAVASCVAGTRSSLPVVEVMTANRNGSRLFGRLGAETMQLDGRRKAKQKKENTSERWPSYLVLSDRQINNGKTLLRSGVL